MGISEGRAIKPFSFLKQLLGLTKFLCQSYCNMNIIFLKILPFDEFRTTYCLLMPKSLELVSSELNGVIAPLPIYHVFDRQMPKMANPYRVHFVRSQIPTKTIYRDRFSKTFLFSTLIAF